MAGPFASTPSRSNGPAIDASWFNLLRAAGIALENFLGTVIGLTSFTIANNQAVAANVTGLVFNGTDVKVALIDFRIRRNTTGAGATERVQAGSMIATFKQTAGTWTLTMGASAGDDAGVIFDITAAGQVQYTSDSQTGTADESTMKFTVRTLA